MKNLPAIFFFFSFLYQLKAQTTTGRIEGLRDEWGTTIDYVGEIKNKQPNGLGIAIYSNDYALRYSGYFVNGQYNGKGVLLLKDGGFLSGNWKSGKLNGKGANLSKSGDLYVGDFVDGKRNGNGVYFYADNSFITGSMKDDTYEGRCIYIPQSGKTVSDNLYVNGKKSGSGYQYELDSKTLYEGTWNNGDWVSNSTATFNSFLKSGNFYAEKTDNQILIGSIDKTNNNLLQDTGFFYNLEKHSRYFGYNEKGYLADGIIVKDSSRFIGKLNDNGAYGHCSFYKTNKFFDEGNYLNDYLNGSNNLSIDFDKKTIYYGETADKGAFTGKAWYTNKYNELYNGDYKDGSFSGTGYIVFSNGVTLKGTFSDGRTKTVASLTDGNGMEINRKPKTFSEALSIITNEFSNNYLAFEGDNADEDEYTTADYYNSYKSIISFPNTVETDVILEDFEFYMMYNATMYKGSSYQDAVIKYNELCKSLSNASLHLKYSTAPVTLSGSMKPAEESKTTRTKFSLNNYSSLSGYNVYAELKYDAGNYKVNLVAGDVDFDK